MVEARVHDLELRALAGEKDVITFKLGRARGSTLLKVGGCLGVQLGVGLGVCFLLGLLSLPWAHCCSSLHALAIGTLLL